MSQKHIEYAAIISAKIGELLEDDSDIDKDELMEGDNLTHFFHALANVAPTHIYNSMTEQSLNNLEFNHIANQLVFQYSMKKQKPEP